jgi:hypothetical protein
MASLHTLNSAQYSRWQHCRATLTSGDLLLLIEDGGYLLKTIEEELPAGVQLHCLQSDLHSRGIPHTDSATPMIDYAQWVKLCSNYQRHISW